MGAEPRQNVRHSRGRISPTDRVKKPNGTSPMSSTQHQKMVLPSKRFAADLGGPQTRPAYHYYRQQVAATLAHSLILLATPTFLHSEEM